MKGSGRALEIGNCSDLGHKDNTILLIDKDRTQQLLSQMFFPSKKPKLIPLFLEGNENALMFNGNVDNSDNYKHNKQNCTVTIIDEKNMHEYIDDIADKPWNKCNMVKAYHFTLNVLPKYDQNNSVTERKQVKIIVSAVVTGTLEDFKQNYLGDQQPIERLFIVFLVLCDIINTLECMYNNGLYYTFITLQNIFYNCVENKISILFRNFYSKHLQKETHPVDLITQYPNNLRTTTNIKAGAVPNVYDMIYGLFIIYYNLFNDPNTSLHWDKPVAGRLPIVDGFFDTQIAEFSQFAALLTSLKNTMIIRNETDSALLNDPKLFESVRTELNNLVRAIYAALDTDKKQKYKNPDLYVDVA